jgi:hypothetical protein
MNSQATKTTNDGATEVRIFPIKTDIPRTVIRNLISQGWIADRLLDDVATREFDTFVGTKTAIVYCKSSPGEKVVVLSGNYLSEGHNVLAASSVLIEANTGQDQLRTVVDRFLSSIEKRIRETYAMRLMASISAEGLDT